MARSSIIVIALLLATLGVQRGYWATRVWLLPAITPGVVARSDASLEAQRAAWIRYDEVLRCEALGPCLATLTSSNWEGNRDAIAKACQAAHDRIGALEAAPELPDAVRSNAALLRTYWLRKTASYVTQANGAADDGGDWTALLTFSLDTCTPRSIPSQIDQLYGLVAAGSASASCAEVRTLK